MTYRVLWSPAAERQLAELWLSAADRSAVAEAADRLDELLRTGAESAGESRSGGDRIVFCPPLVAFVTVDVPGRRAIVRRLQRF